MSQDSHIQGLITSIHNKMKLAQEALVAVPDEHVAEVVTCEAELAKQLRTLLHDYSEAAHAADENSLEELDRRTSALLSNAQKLQNAHKDLLGTIAQIDQSTSAASQPQYDVPEFTLDQRFADDEGVFGVGRRDTSPSLKERAASAFRQGKSNAKHAADQRRRGIHLS